MTRKIFLILVFTLTLTSCHTVDKIMPQQNSEIVVLLHGIFRSKLDMHPMAKFLEGKGYKTINILYPSREQNLEELSDFIHQKSRMTLPIAFNRG